MILPAKVVKKYEMDKFISENQTNRYLSTEEAPLGSGEERVCRSVRFWYPLRYLGMIQVAVNEYHKRWSVRCSEGSFRRHLRS